MISNWKLSADGLTASRVLAGGEIECRLVTAVDQTELAGALPPDLVDVKNKKSALIMQSAQSAIIGGFSSSALGAANAYPSTVIDQQNINAVALVGGSLWCADATGKWAFVAHTKAQAAAVQADMVAWIQAQQTKNAARQAAIAAATTVAAVQAVVW